MQQRRRLVLLLLLLLLLRLSPALPAQAIQQPRPLLPLLPLPPPPPPGCGAPRPLLPRHPPHGATAHRTTPSGQAVPLRAPPPAPSPPPPPPPGRPQTFVPHTPASRAPHPVPYTQQTPPHKKYAKTHGAALAFNNKERPQYHHRQTNQRTH